MDKIYVSLDEAREELKKRWEDTNLRKRIEAELGENFMPYFSENPRGVLGKSLPAPDNGFAFFFQCAHYINAVPLVLESPGDKFVSINPEKKGLCNISVCLENNQRNTINVADINSYEGKKINEIRLKTGEKLVDFYHKLFKVSKYDVELRDITNWFYHIGSASDYYYPYLLHFVTHGVLFEYFATGDDEREKQFVSSVIRPAIDKIEKKFGLKPLIIKAYPDNQNEAEDFYWWCFPSHVNDYIVDYAKGNKINFKITNYK